jgi:glycerol kinase
MSAPLLLAIDQGTSATKCVLVNQEGSIVARGAAPLGEAHPQPGWVEQNALEIWRSVQSAVQAVMQGQDPGDVVAVGLSNQRETVAVWDAASGEPLAPALSWQDQRPAALCDAMRTPDVERLVRRRSGLPLDPMFSAAKAKWLLDHIDPDRSHSRRGEIRLGTVDSWIISRFCGEHLIEAGNASRTQLLGVVACEWDDDLLALFDIPRATLPRITASTGPFPSVRGLAPLKDGVPLLSVMGDSHAALFAHGARVPGQVKATYGTGSSVMGLVARPQDLDPGLCLTIGWWLDGPAYAAEGNIRASGSSLRWLATLFGRTPEELSELGAKSSAHGVVLVPGFTGLGAPWWDGNAVGLFTNLRLDTDLSALSRATLDAIVHQVADVTDAMARSGSPVSDLFTDGGPSRSDFLMQMQADLIPARVLRSRDAELSAMGVAHMAGLAAGVWSAEALQALPRVRDAFAPAMSADERATSRARWQRGVARARSG